MVVFQQAIHAVLEELVDAHQDTIAMRMVAALTESFAAALSVAAPLPLEEWIAALVASPLIKSAVGSMVVLKVMAVVLTDHALVQETLLPLPQLPVLALPLQLQRLILLHRAEVSFRVGSRRSQF